jgi:hypothetical protein
VRSAECEVDESMFHDELVNCVCEFLEAAIHTTLWARKLYSADLFERNKYCGFTVRRSRHPGLNSYISETVGRLKVRSVGHPCTPCKDAAPMKMDVPLLHLAWHSSNLQLQGLIKTQALQEVAIVVFDPRSGLPIERTTFQVQVRPLASHMSASQTTP